MVHVRLEQEWTDGQGATHAAGDMVDVDAATLAALQRDGIVGGEKAAWAGPTGAESAEPAVATGGEKAAWAGPTSTEDPEWAGPTGTDWAGPTGTQP